MHAVRVSNGKVLYGNNANVKRNPASNIKLFTAAAALRELRPWHRFTTTLKGEKDGSHVANLVVVGGGDPTLGQMELLKIASRLKRLGVKSIGKISIDAFLFWTIASCRHRLSNNQARPPHFGRPSQPSRLKELRTRSKSSRLQYWVPRRPSSSTFRAILRSKTKPPPTMRITPISKSPNAPLGKHRMVMRVEGILPIDDPPVTFPQRVLNPLAHAAYALSAALRTVGIKGKQLRRRVEPPAQALPLLVEHRSDSLDDILKRLGKRSDNFTAEMLLKAMGKQEGIPASSAAALNVVRQQMKSIGVPVEQITLVNGSGLFNGNASTPRAFTTLLRRMALDPEVGPDFVAHLSISRGDGTLKRRKRLPRIRRPRKNRNSRRGCLVVRLHSKKAAFELDRVQHFAQRREGSHRKSKKARRPNSQRALTPIKKH